MLSKQNVIEVERRKYYIFYYEKKFHKNKNKTNSYIIVRLHCDCNDYQEHDWIDIESRLKTHQNKTKFLNLKELSLTTVAWFKDEEKNKAIKINPNGGP